LTTRLFDLEIEEVSLVDSPAIRRSFSVIKREGGDKVNKSLMPIPMAAEFLRELALTVDVPFEKRKILKDLSEGLYTVFEQGAKAPIEDVNKVTVKDAIALLEELKGIEGLPKDMIETIDEVIALLEKIKASGYPRPYGYGYPKPYGYQAPYGYPYPAPVTASEDLLDKVIEQVTSKVKETLTTEVGKVITSKVEEVATSKIEEALSTKVEEVLTAKAKDQGSSENGIDTKELSAKVVEDLGIEKKLKEFEETITAAVKKAVEGLDSRVNVLEKTLAISQRILPDDKTQKRSSASDFWKGILPF